MVGNIWYDGYCGNIDKNKHLNQSKMNEKKTMASQWLKQRQKEQGFLTDADFHAASVMEKEYLM